jgi:hypothetical protein
MRCLAPAEAEAIFGPEGFDVSLDHAWYRRALRLGSDRAVNEDRIAGRPTVDPSQLALFALEVNAWLPTNRSRLLWIDHWNSDYPGVDQMVVAARAGLGETRSLSEAPGHLFDSYPYDERDQQKISPDQSRETSILVSLMTLIMIGGWDAWLVAGEGADRVEFWEGNIFFYSGDPTMLSSAETLLARFNCARTLT